MWGILLVIAIVISAVAGYYAAPSKNVEVIKYASPYDSTTYDSLAALASYMNATYPVNTQPGKGLVFRFISHGGIGSSWFAPVYKGVNDAAKLLGCTVTIDECADDAALMATRLDEAIAANVSGIAISLVSADAFNVGVAYAVSKGIPVVAWNVDVKGNARLAYVGQDNRGAAVALGNQIVKLYHIGPTDHALITAGNPILIQIAARVDGFKEALDAVGATYDVLTTTSDIATAEQRITAYLAAHPETTVVFGCGGDETARSGLVVQTLGKTPGQIKVAGFDLEATTFDLIKSGYVQIAVDQQPYLQGFIPIVELYLAAKWSFTPANYDTGMAFCTKDNVALFEAGMAAGMR